MSGRRAGIVLKLLPITLVLLAVPWVAGRYFGRFAEFALAGQKTSLPLAAQAVAGVLADRADLFAVAAGRPLLLEECGPRALAGEIHLDGESLDWRDLALHRCGYGRGDVGGVGVGGDGPPTGFALALGVRGDDLYAFVEVTDDVVRYRHPHDRNLDGSDHLRLTVPDPAGGEHRWVVTATRSGTTTTYEADADWRADANDGVPARVRGYWRETPDGYAVELRIPRSKLSEGLLGIAVADVDETGGSVERVVGAVPAGEVERMRGALLASAETAGILRGDDLPGAAVTVVDAGGHVRVRGGGGSPLLGPDERTRLLGAALTAASGRDRGFEAPPGAGAAGVALPIRAGGAVVGAVLVEQPSQEVLAGEPDVFEQARVVITAACGAIAGVLLFFAWRLAWRIRRLRDEAGAAIDRDGRVLRSELSAGRRARDEIGDLSRTVSGLLGRLDHYTTFLEQVPRTLRHEISNPLNGLATSLENLAAEHPELSEGKYVRSAERAIARIDAIVQGLTDAASLEQALRDDEPETVDLAQLVPRYVENFASGRSERSFSVRGADRPAVVRASGFRIEQLLDKLFDNAVAFSPAGSEIAVGLDVSGARVRLAVENQGPPVPPDLGDRIFDSMVTTQGGGDRPHLGLGLYVVRVIAEHLGGRVAAANRPAGGVAIEVTLPIADRAPSRGPRAGA